MEILVNGNKEVFEAEAISLLELLTRKDIREGQHGVAVAVNYSVIPRSMWAQTLLNPGDEVEIIRATAGG